MGKDNSKEPNYGLLFIAICICFGSSILFSAISSATGEALKIVSPILPYLSVAYSVIVIVAVILVVCFLVTWLRNKPTDTKDDEIGKPRKYPESIRDNWWDRL